MTQIDFNLFFHFKMSTFYSNNKQQNCEIEETTFKANNQLKKFQKLLFVNFFDCLDISNQVRMMFLHMALRKSSVAPSIRYYFT